MYQKVIVRAIMRAHPNEGYSRHKDYEFVVNEPTADDAARAGYARFMEGGGFNQHMARAAVINVQPTDAPEEPAPAPIEAAPVNTAETPAVTEPDAVNEKPKKR